ncbi:hypothetical protein EM308_10005 [Flavobacterium gilvum]|uniref:Uncharacterized protein n=1 Tax=Flavobacterium gilvum TaxID=1492737 RepID=A0AAC9I3U9_9FLAO|nr:hypothetical protein EM308_10005 [Flavobacterium gilvum]KFC58099.1 hypothetical protein FEM08_31670 [Flavobacterium gilvum]
MFLGIIHLYIQKREIPISNFIIYSHVIISIGGFVLVWFLNRKLNDYSSLNAEEFLNSMQAQMYLTYICLATLLLIILTQLVFVGVFFAKIFRN